MRGSGSGPGYTYSSFRLLRGGSMLRTAKVLACCLLAVAWYVAGCGGGDGAGAAAKTGGSMHPNDVEFRTAWAEVELAKGDGPYLVLDLGRRAIDLRLKGVLLWTCPLKYDNPDCEAALETEFCLGTERDSPVAFLTGKHLYTCRARFADSVLAVVARVARVDAGHLQRYEPGYFNLRFGRRLVVDVRTDTEAGPVSRLGNAFARARDGIAAPLTKVEIAVRMEPEDALTLYRAAHPHLPILVSPSAKQPG
jgi:hypothetical protein